MLSPSLPDDISKVPSRTAYFVTRIFPQNIFARSRKSLSMSAPDLRQFAPSWQIGCAIIGAFDLLLRHMDKHEVDHLAVMLFSMALDLLVLDRRKGRAKTIWDVMATIAGTVEKITDRNLAHRSVKVPRVREEQFGFAGERP
jgi:hypothetical protein